MLFLVLLPLRPRPRLLVLLGMVKLSRWLRVRGKRFMFTFDILYIWVIFKIRLKSNKSRQPVKRGVFARRSGRALSTRAKYGSTNVKSILNVTLNPKP